VSWQSALIADGCGGTCGPADPSSPQPARRALKLEITTRASSLSSDSNSSRSHAPPLLLTRARRPASSRHRLHHPRSRTMVISSSARALAGPALFAPAITSSRNGAPAAAREFVDCALYIAVAKIRRRDDKLAAARSGVYVFVRSHLRIRFSGFFRTGRSPRSVRNGFAPGRRLAGAPEASGVTVLSEDSERARAEH